MEEILQTIEYQPSGSESCVSVQLRNTFPGLGGTIVTEQAVPVACRENLVPIPMAGHQIFFKHVLLKKLDDFFCRMGRYTFPHIARPLGSFSTAYLYEWVRGTDTFAWAHRNSDGTRTPVTLHEWKECVEAFVPAGITIDYDVSDVENGIVAKNVVHQLPATAHLLKMNLLWVRIDFGYRSLPIDHDKLLRFLDRYAGKMRDLLGEERYELVLLAEAYVRKGGALADRELGKLDILERDFRLSALRQHNPRIALP